MFVRTKENYIVLDLETKKLSSEVEGGWNNIAAFGVAIAVLWHEGRYPNREGFFSIHAEWHENRNEYSSLDATKLPIIPIDTLAEKEIFIWDIELLISYLEEAEKIVSFNGIAFDYVHKVHRRRNGFRRSYDLLSCPMDLNQNSSIPSPLIFSTD